ncbi:MAG: ankyrin repeat domain-containing protein [Waddliaceae bacterium]
MSFSLESINSISAKSSEHSAPPEKLNSKCQQVQDIAKDIFHNSIIKEKLAEDMQSGSTETLKFLLKAGVDPVLIYSEAGIKDFHEAAARNNPEKMKALIDKGVDVDEPSRDGGTALHVAAENGDLNILDLLLSAKANIHVAMHNGVTPLQLAAQNGRLEVVKWLLKSGVNVNASACDNSTALHDAAERGQSAVVKVLLEAGTDVNATLLNGVSPLQLAAQAGHLKTAKELIHANACINHLAIDNSTALHGAAQNGHLSVLRALVQAGADVNAVSIHGYNALFPAAQNGHFDVIKELISAGTTPLIRTLDGVTALHIAAQNGHRNIVNALLIDKDVKRDLLNATIYSGESALHLAVRNRHLDVVKKLLDEGAELDRPDKYNKTVLTIAIDNRWFQAVKALLDAKVRTDSNALNQILKLCQEVTREELLSIAGDHRKARSIAQAINYSKALIKKLSEQATVLLQQNSIEIRSEKSLNDFLLELEIEHKNAKVKKSKKKKANHKKSNFQNIEKLIPEQAPKNAVKSAAIAENIPNNLVIEKQLMIQNLYKMRVKIHARVSRWKCSNPDIISQFLDKGIEKYSHNTQAENLKLRARHYLPGTELIAENPIYSITKNTGKCLLAEFTYDNHSQFGVVTFGYTEDGCLYHRFFEEGSINRYIFAENKCDIDEFQEDAKQEVEVSGWSSNLGYEMSVQDNGCILLNYHKESYTLKVFPIRQDLLPDALNGRG